MLPNNVPLSPIFSFPRIFGENPHLINRFSNLFRPHAVSSFGRTQEDPSKLKVDQIYSI